MAAPDDLLRLIPRDRQDREKPSTTKYNRLDDLFGRLLGVDPVGVYTTGISKPGNVTVRATQSQRAVRARYLVLLVEDAELPNQLTGTVAAAAQFVGPGQKRAAIVVSESKGGAHDWEVRHVIEAANGPVHQALEREWTRADRVNPAPRKASGPGPSLAVPLTMDDSTTRMARLAVATSPAVLFVGPPGTGKNRLLSEIIREIQESPQTYGFSRARDVVVEPAEEGWTTRDLVGGETIDERRNTLRFRPGKVLDAIANDRWLVIDEANRADLDRIFGGLLTWLSRQQVVVGRASTKVGAPLVRLGWTDEPSSFAQGADRLAAEDVGAEPIDYWAGTEFRLLGTYNAVDAQRVFRFGLALGRRFSQVPVPPAKVEDFAAMLETTAADLTDASVRKRVTGRVVELYRAHHGTASARLGPAFFLGIPEYVATGLQLADLVGVDAGDERDIDRLVVEAYLLATGAWLARLETSTELSELAQRLTTATTNAAGQLGPPVLDVSEWDWLAGQLPTIGG